MNLYSKVLSVTVLSILCILISFILIYEQTKLRKQQRLTQLTPHQCKQPITSNNSTRIVFESLSYRRDKRRKYAMATFFASIDFLPALEVFLLTYNAIKSKYPLIIAIPSASCLDKDYDPGIDREFVLLQFIQQALSKYPQISYQVYAWPLIIPPLRTNPRWRVNYSKLHLWEMVDYDKILYVDLDTIIMKNLDVLFSLDVSQFYLGSHDYGKYTSIGSTKMNGGVFLMKPNPDVFQALLDMMVHGAEKYRVIEAEQGLFNYYFNSTTHCCLPAPYNVQKSVSKYLPMLWDINKMAVLHFVGEKPWTSWSSTLDRAMAFSPREILRRRKRDLWDAHEYQALHELWKILYFTARRSDFQQLQAYLLPLPDTNINRRLSSSFSSQRSLHEVNHYLSDDWNLNLHFVFDKVILFDKESINGDHDQTMKMFAKDRESSVVVDYALNASTWELYQLLSVFKYDDIKKLSSPFLRKRIPVKHASAVLPALGSIGRASLNEESSSYRSKAVKYISLLDLSSMSSIGIDWTKVHLYPRPGQIVSLFYWHRIEYQSFYEDLDLTILNHRLRSAHLIDPLNSVYWSAIATHASFQLPRMAEVSYYPAAMKNFILPRKVWEIFLRDLSIFIDNFVNHCDQQEAESCVCSDPNHQTDEKYSSNQIFRMVVLSHDNRDGKNFYLDCMKRSAYVYWLLWMRVHDIAMVYAVETSSSIASSL
jgi:lipopolysaccharide biosynthesis glycosyltransferase